MRIPRFTAVLLVTLCVVVSGCGSTKGRLGTDQLLASDAVDRAVSKIDFRALAGQTVYLDTKYLKTDAKRAIGYVDGDYVVSSLRQQIIAAACHLVDSPEEAEFVIEARIGALGSDDREIVWGLPRSNALNAAASAAAALAPSTPAIPTIPEISIARREDHTAAAKLSCFAYHRETRQPVWQSGLAMARSRAKETYILGAGPFQKGEIYDGIQFADDKLAETLVPVLDEGAEPIALGEPYLFSSPESFHRPAPDPEVMTAGHEQPAE